MNGTHIKRIIQRHNEKHQHGEVRAEAANSLARDMSSRSIVVCFCVTSTDPTFVT